MSLHASALPHPPFKLERTGAMTCCARCSAILIPMPSLIWREGAGGRSRDVSKIKILFKSFQNFIQRSLRFCTNPLYNCSPYGGTILRVKCLIKSTFAKITFLGFDFLFWKIWQRNHIFTKPIHRFWDRDWSLDKMFWVNWSVYVCILETCKKHWFFPCCFACFIWGRALVTLSHYLANIRKELRYRYFTIAK